MFIAIVYKNPGVQVGKAVACKAWGHKFESCCSKKTLLHIFTWLSGKWMALVIFVQVANIK